MGMGATRVSRSLQDHVIGDNERDHAHEEGEKDRATLD